MQEDNTVRDFEDYQIADILAVQRMLIRVGTYTDEKRWDELRHLFAEEVTIDFGEVKAPQVIKADDLIAWSKRTYRLIKSQHMFMNQDVQVDGNRASATSYGRALHQRTDTGEVWMIYNRYEHSLVKTAAGWKVERLKMEPTWQTGNPNLLDEALASSN